ncbi:hypothetical protein NX905_02225 [Burkholderia thailandensis]|uniref:hypothetical protein n=1 Tax=Burkholderia thailandensis TaxID=57975 RepID=UPI00217DE118|nr:hypothetical protein [Burkholderia thailandensis]MCS6493079.1 hypothetical protein [Burkholderia thailandensis]
MSGGDAIVARVMARSRSPIRDFRRMTETGNPARTPRVCDCAAASNEIAIESQASDRRKQSSTENGRNGRNGRSRASSVFRFGGTPPGERLRERGCVTAQSSALSFGFANSFFMSADNG